MGLYSKLRTYIEFKQNYNIENYLNIEDVPHSCRKPYCNIRISYDDLDIEKGKYYRPKKPHEQRIGQVCKIESETEQHFILSCPAYTNIRKKLFIEIRARCQSIQVINYAERLKILLSSQEGYIITNVMQFIFYAHKKRQDILGDTARKTTPDVPPPSSDTNLNI